MSAYTPGPWHWDSDPIKGDPLCRVRYRVTTTGKTITQCYYSSDDMHAEHDARLIAAAPDGLAAAQMAYAVLLVQPHGVWRIRNQHVYAALRDFIAKATGRDPEDVQNEYEAAAMEGQS